MKHSDLFHDIASSNVVVLGVCCLCNRVWAELTELGTEHPVLIEILKSASLSEVHSRLRWLLFTTDDDPVQCH